MPEVSADEIIIGSEKFSVSFPVFMSRSKDLAGEGRQRGRKGQ